jgi:hypothetical protein
LEGGEPFAVVATEAEMDALVSVEAEELSYDLDRENLRVGELGGGPALADTAILEPVVHQAEDGYDEGAKIHERRPPFCPRWFGVPMRVRRSLLWLKPLEKLAHGVNYLRGMANDRFMGVRAIEKSTSRV